MTGTDRHSFNPRPFVRGDDLFCGVFCGWGISIHALLQGDKRCYLVSSRTAAANPTAKACFCQSSYRASNSGFIFSPPLDFSLLVCYHRFSSVSALCWVVSATVCRRALTALFFFAQNKCNPLSNRCCFCKFVVFTVLQKCPVRVCINPDF